ncbi:MAG: hypothetical protein K0S07_1642 [Chlamydiales bacterium]|jgi:hypothetical protein|nr:hypothetical protein [Chlamydiales bacterium]
MNPSSDPSSPFYLQKGNVFLLPALHHNLETAFLARQAFLHLKPDCVAVELPKALEPLFMRAAARLPDISVVTTQTQTFLAQPADALFEGLRSGLESGVFVTCIDQSVEDYPECSDPLPDPYAIARIGMASYYAASKDLPKESLDKERELHMARRLKEMSFRYERILFIGGLAHIEGVASALDQSAYPVFQEMPLSGTLATLSEHSCREVLSDLAWLAFHYEEARLAFKDLESLKRLDRQRLFLSLLQKARAVYEEETYHLLTIEHIKTLLRFARNLSFLHRRLIPSFYQQLTAAKACVDDNYAYTLWEMATAYPHLQNRENLPALDLSPKDIWGFDQLIRFSLRQKGKKESLPERFEKKGGSFQFRPIFPEGICSYPKEDVFTEKYADYLKKKGSELLQQEGPSIPFLDSIEEGIDVRATLKHPARKLHVKKREAPPKGTGSFVIIFSEEEKYSWQSTWLGEHNQESDMAFYATPLQEQVVGPGICRCEYGGFMLSSPPRRLYDVFTDPDYQDARSPAEMLLMAAIDYSVKPLIVYVAKAAPRSFFRDYAARQHKKIVYIPFGQLSSSSLNRLRFFHVLDSHRRRSIADDYIF